LALINSYILLTGNILAKQYWPYPYLDGRPKNSQNMAIVRAKGGDKSRRALDPFCYLHGNNVVERPTIKVLGILHKTPWQRFGRVQRTAARLAKGRGQPKGVFRFATNEACNEWTANLNRSEK
jgi:hypothetical protein